MKAQKILGLVCLVALAFPMLASAQIYKWKDKNGVTRYSDMPPPGNVKQIDMLGKKSSPKRTQPEQASSELEVTNKPVDGKRIKPQSKIEDEMDAENRAAELRARNAETEKMDKLAKDKQMKADAENCKAAQKNYETYGQGGRIFKINDKGERVFEDEAGLAAGKQKAQAEIQKYCK